MRISVSLSLYPLDSFTCHCLGVSNSSLGDAEVNTILPSQWHQFLCQLLLVILLLGMTLVPRELLGLLTQAPYHHAMA